MAEAFISYSRRDKDFVIELKDRLKAEGFEVHIDLEGILASEDWAKRITDMIAAADHFVFVLSPDSCRSRICSVEVNSALELSKSIVPVLYRETGGELIPEAIRQRQWIRCETGDRIDACVRELAATFSTAPGWIRLHTELSRRGRDWRGTPRRSALLSGKDLARAESWLRSAEGSEPAPSALQIAYIQRSRQWARTKAWVGIALAAAAIAGAAVAWWRIDAEQRLSVDKQLVATAADWMPRDPTRAALVLLEVADPDRTPYAVAALHQALSEPIARCEIDAGGIQQLALSHDSLMVVNDGALRSWDLDCRERLPQATVAESPRQEHAAGHQGEKACLTFSSRGDVVWWELGGGEPRRRAFQSGGELEHAWFTDDGNVVTLRRDFAVELWTVGDRIELAATYHPFASRPGYGTVERALFHAPSGKLAVKTYGSALMTWTLGSDAEATLLSWAQPEPDLLAFDPSGDFVVGGRLGERSPYEAVFYAADGSGETEKLGPHEEPLAAALFFPEKRKLVTEAGSVVRIWDLDDLHYKPPLRLREPAVKVQRIDPPSVGDLLTFSRDGTARLWRLDAPDEPVAVLKGSPVSVAAVDETGRLLATGTGDGTVRLWRIGPGAREIALESRADVVADAIFSADGEYAIARVHYGIDAWRRPFTGERMPLEPPESAPVAMALHPTKSLIAIADEKGGIWLRALEPDAQLRPVGVHEGIKSLAFDEAGEALVTGDAGGSLQVWPLTDRGEHIVLAPFEDSLGDYQSLWMSSRAGRVVAASALGIVSWALDAPDAPVRVAKEFSSTAAAAPAAGLVATVNIMTNGVELWHADGSGLVAEFGAVVEPVVALLFSPDARTLMVLSKDGTARLWRTDGSGPVVVLRGHSGWVVDGDFSPDGRRVVTASFDGTARVWNADGTGEEIVLRHPGGAFSARFDPSGSQVITSGSDGMARIWSLSGSRLQTLVSEVTKVCLSSEFRVRFLDENESLAAEKAAACQSR